MADMDFENGEKKYGRGDGETHALVEYSEFKGNKMIVLRRTTDDAYPFQFGSAKAKLILDNMEAIEQFVKENAKK